MRLVLLSWQAAIQQGYRETHVLLDELADANIDGTRKEYMAELVSVPLLIIDDLGNRKVTLTADEDLLEMVIRRYSRASTMVTSNRPVDDWGKLLADTAAVNASAGSSPHPGHVLKCGPRSWPTKGELTPRRRPMARQRRLPHDASSTVTHLQSNKEARQKRPGSSRSGIQGLRSEASPKTSTPMQNPLLP